MLSAVRPLVAEFLWGIRTARSRVGDSLSSAGLQDRSRLSQAVNLASWTRRFSSDSNDDDNERKDEAHDPDPAVEIISGNHVFREIVSTDVEDYEGRGRKRRRRDAKGVRKGSSNTEGAVAGAEGASGEAIASSGNVEVPDTSLVPAGPRPENFPTVGVRFPVPFSMPTRAVNVIETKHLHYDCS